MCYSEQYARLKRNVFSPRRKADVDCVIFSQSSRQLVGSTFSVRRWKMLDPPFSGLSVGRRSLRDWRPAVTTGMKWQRLAGASPWCSPVIVRVMPCRRENIAYIQFVHWLAANVVLAEHNWCGHVAWGRARLVPPHAGHAVTVPESMLRDQRLLRYRNRGVTVRERRPIASWRLGRADDALSVDGVSERSPSAPVARCGRASVTMRRSEHQDSGL